MIQVIGKFHFKQEDLDRVLELAGELITLTRQEKGCTQYHLLQSTTQEDCLVMLETWENQEAIDSHFQTEHCARLTPQIDALCVTPPVFEVYRPLF